MKYLSDYRIKELMKRERPKMDKRLKVAREQRELLPTSHSKVINHVNNFLDSLDKQVYKTGNAPVKPIGNIELDGFKCKIKKHCIIIDDVSKLNMYRSYLHIRKDYNLIESRNLLWIKFTESGHVGAICAGKEINFSTTSTAGKLISCVGEKWNNDLVIVVPVSDDWIREYERNFIESGLGNYLISKGVAIIDYYSHNW